MVQEYHSIVTIIIIIITIKKFIFRVLLDTGRMLKIYQYSASYQGFVSGSFFYLYQNLINSIFIH